MFLLATALVWCLCRWLPYNPISLVFSIIFLLCACLATNSLFAYLYRAPSNTESVYITAFILALIVTPQSTINQAFFLAAISFFAIG
jgi:Na+-transporting NADH:ubiquinone oxidoreductase subunit NqrB